MKKIAIGLSLVGAVALLALPVLLLALSGQVVFPRFVKLPPVARDKIEEMIRYEAEQSPA